MGRCATIGMLLAAAACAAMAAACGGGDFKGGDGGTDTDTDSDSDTGVVDTDSDSDTDGPDGGGDTDTSLAGPGEPCWKASFGASHPNFGLPDCIAGYVCIGDDTGAWCTETCDATGDIDTSDGPFGGWCCAEFSNPCDPWRFWMPAQLSALCVPRAAGAAESCVEGGTWPSSAVRPHLLGDDARQRDRVPAERRYALLHVSLRSNRRAVRVDVCSGDRRCFFRRLLQAVGRDQHVHAGGPRPVPLESSFA
jgi:hypothetical protein